VPSQEEAEAMKKDLVAPFPEEVEVA